MNDNDKQFAALQSDLNELIKKHKGKFNFTVKGKTVSGISLHQRCKYEIVDGGRVLIPNCHGGCGVWN